jgi:ABC-2 type transport system ATP-binding protein
MDEAQVLADRVAVIATGQIVAQGTPATIGGRDSALTRIRFMLPAGTTAADLPVPASIAVTTGTDGLITIEADEPTGLLHRLTGWAIDRGTTLARLSVDRPSLEDIYLRLTGSDTETEEAEPAKPRRRRALARSGR